MARLQPARIPLDIEHDNSAEVGQVVSLFRSRYGDAWAVAVSDAERLPGYPAPLYFSAQFASRLNPDNLMLAAVALTTESATVAKRPVEMFRGSLDQRWDRSRWNLGGLHKRLVEHAARELRERSARERLLVYAELPAGQVPVRTRGGYLVGDEFIAARDGRPEGKLRLRGPLDTAVSGS